MKKYKIVTIGGGTGSFVLLTGLKKYPNLNISAIVSMADDGGSTGRLRDELGVLPPGDVRQCLVALSESSNTMRRLMNYRFQGGGLAGHSFGNLLISALEKVTGSFAKGVEKAGKILNIKGEVIPVSEGDMRIEALLNDGKIMKGEEAFDDNMEMEKIGVREVYLQKKVRASRCALKKISEADYIILGPASLHPNIIASLLVGGLAAALRNAKAKIIFNCNLTNRKGQTAGFDLDRYVAEIEKYLGRGRIDFVTFNTRKPDEKLITKYERKEGKDMITRCSNLVMAGKYKVVKADLLSTKPARSEKNDTISSTRSFIRHDSDKLARVVMKIVEGKIKQ